MNLKAVVISYNWNTGETLTQEFEGPGCAESATRWVDRNSFVWRDFPEEEGWTHFQHATVEARKELASNYFSKKPADYFSKKPDDILNALDTLLNGYTTP